MSETPTATQEAAEAVLAGILGEQGEAVEEDTPEPEVSEPPAPVAEAPPTPGEAVLENAEQEFDAKTQDVPPEIPSFEYVSEDDLATFEEGEAEAELSEVRERLAGASQEENMYEDEPEELDSEELLRRLERAERALAHQKKLRSRQQRDRWEEEAKKHYPLATVNEIKADSRNAFMKAAAQSHNQILTHLQPHLDLLKKEREKVMAETKEQARAEAAESWGKATAGHTSGEVDEGQFQTELAAARATNDLSKVLGVMRRYNREG